MKIITNYINEKLNLNKGSKIKTHNYQPKDLDELEKIIKQLIKERGDEANLNDIDTSKITNMSFLFLKSNFNGDISGWDVSKVTDMEGMFAKSNFNGNISEWDINNVKDMRNMFYKAKFNGNIFNWDASNVTNMENMFKNSPLEKNPPKWYNEKNN